MLRTRTRKESVTEELYYVRNEGFLGNALWWTKGCNGYTCDINNAKFTREQAEKLVKDTQDSAYLCTLDSLEIAKKVIIDAQYVDKSEEIMEIKSNSHK
jgi:hypothetical protein